MAAVSAAFVAASVVAQTTSSPSASEQADKDAVVELPAFQVKSTQDSGYFVREAISGSKTKQALENLAGAYSVVPRDLLDDLGAIQNAPEGIKFVVPGITPFVKGDQYMIRGRRSGGTSDDGVNSVIFFADSIGIDAIELMKGPQAVLYGQQAGMFGNVLRVTKKPLPSFQGTVSGYYGSDDFRRVELDVTGPLSKGFSYRLIGAQQEADGFLKNAVDNRQVGIATVQWRNDKTTVSLRIEHQDLRQRGDNIQIGTPGKVFTVYTGAGKDEGFFPEWGYYQDIGNIARLNVIHQFNENWQSRVALSRAATFRDYVYLLAPVANFTANTFTQDYFNYAEDFVAKGIYFDNLGKYTFGKVQFQTNFGYSWDEFTPLSFTRSYIPQFFSGILSAPNYKGLVEPRSSVGATPVSYGSVTTATSAYVLETVEVLPDRLILSAGTAYNKSVVENPVTNAITTDQGDWVKRLGAVFKPVKNISLYYGWATMFNPSSVTTRDINGNPMPIITGKGSEIGVKTSFLDGKLTFSADYYKLTRTNISVFTGKLNSQGLGYYELVGDENSKGWEFELHAQLTPNWQLIGVAWKGDSLDRTGAQFFNSLKESAGMFTRYNFTSGTLNGFSLGGGSYAQGRRYFGANAAAGYIAHNVFASYRVKDITVSLNVENLTDKTYVAGAWSQGQVSGGTPRSFRLMVQKRFK
ncbi:MAG: TonB-dependent receptor [Opitutaceae bacterium]|nr:TonB-dependent receptor [Opitutaceae bacterium]